MTLLFDENLSRRLVTLLANEFPGSNHIELLGMRGTTDRAIWDYAADNGLVLVSKDNDFRQRVFLLGPPPKVIWLAIGNAGTEAIFRLLKQNVDQIDAFVANPDEGLLILSLENEA